MRALASFLCCFAARQFQPLGSGAAARSSPVAAGPRGPPGWLPLARAGGPRPAATAAAPGAGSQRAAQLHRLIITKSERNSEFGMSRNLKSCDMKLRVTCLFPFPEIRFFLDIKGGPNSRAERSRRVVNSAL